MTQRRQIGSRARGLLVALATVASTLGGVQADILAVPGDHPTIQAAINAAATAGDRIEVSAGVYVVTSPIDTLGKAVEIVGTIDGDTNPLTIIDGGGSTRLLHIDGGETADTVFENLAFTNGGGTGFGGGLRIVDGSPRFENCLITGCAAGVKGGGMLVENASAPTLQSCRFITNACNVAGGAIFADDTSVVTITASLIEGNDASVGAGIYVNGGSTVSLLDTTVCGNSPDQIDGRFSDLGGNTISESCDCDLGDSDGDGVDDCTDGCPDDPDKTEPGDCGCGVADTDSDADGTPDCLDGCPDDPNKTEPGDCGCGTADTDSDADGTPDCLDGCPDDPNKTEPGDCGCGTADTDSDADGTPDCLDGCPDDPDKIDPGSCGCGIADTDSDLDGSPDCVDGCPDDPDKVEPGECGCGVAEDDRDFDGIPDCLDGCPDDPDKSEPGDCGCGVPDADSDADGTPDCLDGCPDDPQKIEPGLCGCGVADDDSDGDGTPDCQDTDIRVPLDQPTISAAIDAASDGFTIRIAEGVYNELVDFSGKAIVIEGDAADPSLVVIDGTGLAGSIVRSASGEGPGSILRGVTVRGGTFGDPVSEDPDAPFAGGGLIAIDASPTIEDCIFDGNAADLGGGLAGIRSGLTILRCSFTNNAAGTGGGLFIERGLAASISDSTVADNTATGVGGGLHVVGGSFSVTATTIDGNGSGDRGGGIAWDSADTDTPLALVSCAITANESGVAGGGLASTGSIAPTLQACNVCDNAPDQIDGAFEDLGDNDICDDESCPADFDGDGFVKGPDLGFLFSSWGPCPAPCAADFDGDGFVRGPDLGFLFSSWGACP